MSVYLLLVLFLSSCGKQTDVPGTFCVDGTLRLIRYSCGPAVDAYSYCLQPDNDSSNWLPLMISTIPDSLRVNNLRVKACLLETDVTEGPCTLPSQATGKRFYNVMSISRR